MILPPPGFCSRELWMLSHWLQSRQRGVGVGQQATRRLWRSDYNVELRPKIRSAVVLLNSRATLRGSKFFYMFLCFRQQISDILRSRSFLEPWNYWQCSELCRWLKSRPLEQSSFLLPALSKPCKDLSFLTNRFESQPLQSFHIIDNPHPKVCKLFLTLSVRSQSFND